MSYVTSGFAEVVYKGRVASGYREQQFAVGSAVAGFDPADITTIATAYQTFILAIGWPSTSSTAGIEVRVGTADPSAPLVYTTPGGAAGSGGDPLDPPQTSILINKRTALGGRAGRGRCFIGPPDAAVTFDAGTIGSAYLIVVDDAWDALMTTQTTVLGGEPYLLHSGPSPAPTIITSFDVSDRLATQRRRMVR